ncbi:MAG TPA: proline--tRNA ligase [Actinomycetota bacterium]|nr:proline--tRNA ligase [Actinomycetota bacterium]
MRLSHLFAPTLREDPAEAEVASHRLLLRAGFIRQVAAGVYTTLPLGVRSMRKIEEITRDEMDASGAQEIRMPIVLPAEPWKATGRFDLYGELLFKLTDRHGRQMLLGPTEEEVVAPLVAANLPSYRDLPVNLYQVEWKYRDEFRPRFGLLRVREFLMKDAYSFDRDEEGMRASYDVMYAAYERILDRCGLDHVTVEADPGQIGGGVNHEFMARAEIGEDLFVECSNGDYFADVEAARPMAPEPADQTDLLPVEVLDTPDTPTIDALASLLGVEARETLKCVMFDAGGQTVAVLVPGDREVAEPKLERLFFPTPLRPFEDVDFVERGFVKGYVGPQVMPDDAIVLADHTVRGGRDWITGANERDHHVRGANMPRDFRVDRFEDLVEIREGDRCPIDGGALRMGRSIVVGHIFQLHTKYSEPLKASFIDEDGIAKPFQMGCYGMGISRIMAAAAEQRHDDAGLRWPKAIAPFQVEVILATRDHERAVAESERIYADLVSRGVEVLFDDREDAAGVKFADADLIGCPVQVVVGTRGIQAGSVDLKLRATGERSQVPLAGAAEAALDLLASAP